MHPILGTIKIPEKLPLNWNSVPTSVASTGADSFSNPRGQSTAGSDGCTQAYMDDHYTNNGRHGAVWVDGPADGEDA